MAAPPITLAAELLDVVKLIYDPAGDKGECETYEARQRARQLLETLTKDVLGPHAYTICIAESCHESAALRLVTECGVADAIGDGAKPVAEISADVGVGIRYLGIALRCVNALGYFEQVGGLGSPVFKNNEMSNILRQGHPHTLKDAVELICDDGFKSAAYFVEATRAAADPNGAHTPASNLAFGFTGSVFRRWLEPEHAWRGKRMGQAMKQLHHAANRNVITGFDWQGLASPIVDVGGGIGTLEMMLAREYPLSEFSSVLFDLQGTIANAKEAWKPLLSTTRAQVDFVAGSFLSSEPDQTGIPRYPASTAHISHPTCAARLDGRRGSHHPQERTRGDGRFPAFFRVFRRPVGWHSKISEAPSL
ncbi:hypothetical protein PsYK624_167430 [Phanerochaete sordida]|uniref:O-methyltransferase C-terminal domain-containing protein n=1 Tax=Phanerochaete sordida TaxID=48140 RepID=A0A9P3GTI1_9APHY|nr:hypothetical protein PsYK624_167430 [Phanerochaete sordida]